MKRRALSDALKTRTNTRISRPGPLDSLICNRGVRLMLRAQGEARSRSTDWRSSARPVHVPDRTQGHHTPQMPNWTHVQHVRDLAPRACSAAAGLYTACSVHWIWPRAPHAAHARSGTGLCRAYAVSSPCTACVVPCVARGPDLIFLISSEFNCYL